MKKFVLILILFTLALVHAEEPKGAFVQVELLSGTKQKAQFLGIANDTVSLGGYIRNKFTVVKFPKTQFKSIVDENGNDMLHPADSAAVAAVTAEAAVAAPATSAPAVDSAATADSASVAATDAVAPATADSSASTPDSTATATAAADTTTMTADTATATDNLDAEPSGNSTIPDKVFMGIESTDIETPRKNQLNALIIGLMQEHDPTIDIREWSAFPACGDRACIQNHWKAWGVKEIYFGKATRAKNPDSLVIEITRAVYEEELPTIYKAETVTTFDNTLHDVIKGNRIGTLVMNAMGIPTPKIKDTKSYIHVETDPESATISRPEKNSICRSPCTFAVRDTGKIELNAFWNVDKHLWGAQTFVRPIPGDTAKVSLKLKRIIPEVRIVSNPAGAEIFPGSDKITLSSESIGKTPKIVNLTTPGMASLRLRKAGFRDTLVNFYVSPVSEINLDISMEHLTDFEELNRQEEWFHKRKVSFIGKCLMGSSIAPVLVGSLFLYLAKMNYDDADDIKHDLTLPSSSKGDNFNRMVRENKDLVDSGDRDIIIGTSLIGTGIAIFGLGFFLQF